MAPRIPTWDDDRPIYRQLAQLIVARIIDGTYREGEMLPSVRQLAGDFSVNPLTAARACRELEEFTEMQRGMGMVIKKGTRSVLLQRERKHFLHEEWPSIRARIDALDLDARELLK